MHLAREAFALRPANRSDAFPFSGLVIVDGRADDRMVVINQESHGKVPLSPGRGWPGRSKCN
jgi:hypothetical protein